MRFQLIMAVAFLCISSHSAQSEVNWQLTDIEGKLHKPFEDLSTTGIVFVFVSTDCPIANSYQPLLGRLHEEYTKNGVRLFQVHPHSNTSVEKARKHAADYRIKSPILIDADQSLARRVGATVTPEVFVFRRDEAPPSIRDESTICMPGMARNAKSRPRMTWSMFWIGSSLDNR